MFLFVKNKSILEIEYWRSWRRRRKIRFSSSFFFICQIWIPLSLYLLTISNNNKMKRKEREGKFKNSPSLFFYFYSLRYPALCCWKRFKNKIWVVDDELHNKLTALFFLLSLFWLLLSNLSIFRTTHTHTHKYI